MQLSRNQQLAINLVIAGISILVWVVLLFNPGHIMGVQHCHVSDAGPSNASLKMLLAMNPVSWQLTGWGLMVVAMMLPKLTFPVQHIYQHSFKRDRLPLSLLFVFGYISVWMIVGVGMIAVILGAHLLMPGSYVPAIVLLLIALVWQFSPIKQRCLNRGHDHWILPAFGWQAYRGALLFGAMHGVWCVGAGWAIMLLPMLLPSGHNPAMIAVTFIMLSEHLEHPRVPRWRINFSVKLFWIIINQTKIKWGQMQVVNGVPLK